MKTIPLTRGLSVLVDDADYDSLIKHKWYAHQNNGGFYAARKPGKDTIFMHNEIMNPPPGMTVDHFNRNSLDCQRSNLRIISRGENLRNAPKRRGSSKFHGVSWHKAANKWRAYVTISSKGYHLGLFKDEREAATMYNLAILRMGISAPLNEVTYEQKTR